MALKKTIAGSVRQEQVRIDHEDGSYSIENRSVTEPSIDVEMHPLEEAEIRAHWAIHDVKMKMLPKPSQKEEHDWLIENGSDFVKQKRDEWQKSVDSVLPELKIAEDYHQECVKKWHCHIECCIDKNLNPDVTEEGKYDAVS